MTASTPTPDREVPVDHADAVALARHLFHRYRARCFWHWRPDVVVGADDIAAILHGLRTNGDRQAWLDAARLEAACKGAVFRVDEPCR
jgi:hypothetical protein